MIYPLSLLVVLSGAPSLERYMVPCMLLILTLGNIKRCSHSERGGFDRKGERKRAKRFVY